MIISLTPKNKKNRAQAYCTLPRKIRNALLSHGFQLPPILNIAYFQQLVKRKSSV